MALASKSNVTFTADQVSALLGAPGTVTKALPATTPTSQLTYNPGGLFAYCGFEDAVITAVPVEYQTIATELRAYPSNYMDRVADLITEAPDRAAGAEANAPCDDPPTAGIFKTCAIQHPYGLFSRQSPVFNIRDAGKVKNRGVNQNLRIVGGNRLNSPFVPTPMRGGTTNLVDAAYMLAWNAVGFEMVQTFGPKIWNGNPANNTAGGGYKEFIGLNLLVRDNYSDAIATGTTCPGLNSYIYDFAGANISTNAVNIVRRLTNVFRNKRILARKSGLAPVELEFWGPESLFYALTEIWPCAYDTFRCATTGAQQQLNLSPERNIRMTEEMRAGQYLLIDNIKVRYGFDEFIPETRVAGTGGAPDTYTTDLWLLPRTIAGGIDALFMEYFNYDQPEGSMDAARRFGVEQFYDVTDGGMFLMHHKPPTNTCVQEVVYVEPRLILATPQLAARLLNLSYTPLLHDPTSVRTNPAFVAGGGVSTR